MQIGSYQNMSEGDKQRERLNNLEFKLERMMEEIERLKRKVAELSK